MHADCYRDARAIVAKTARRYRINYRERAKATVRAGRDLRRDWLGLGDRRGHWRSEYDGFRNIETYEYWHNTAGQIVRLIVPVSSRYLPGLWVTNPAGHPAHSEAQRHGYDYAWTRL